MEIFDMAAEERRGLADLLETLTPDQLASRSLCGEWTVKDVGAHLLAVLETTVREFLWLMALSAGNFNRVNVKLTARRAARPVEALAAELRRRAGSRFTPPGLGPEAPLTDLLIHGLDIRRPLGIPRVIPEDRTRVALDFLATTSESAFVGKGRLRGLRVEATDLDWAAGSGPVARGTSDDLLLAISGRVAGAERLDGEGAAVLRQRVS